MTVYLIVRLINKVPEEAVISVVSSHSGIHGFQVLNSSYLREKLSALLKIQNAISADSFIFLYHKPCRRIDIEFYSAEKDVKLKITFEHGSPKFQNKDEYYQDLRNA